MLQIRREAKELRRIPSLGCEVERLLPAREINLEEIFNSEEMAGAWEAIRPALEEFEIPDGTGGVNPGDRRAIFYLVSYFKPHSVLEIGTHIGASTVHIAAALRQAQRPSSEWHSSLISVDIGDINEPFSKPWLQYGTRLSPVEMINRLGCGSVVEFVTSRSLDYMANCEQRHDFIFLDGDHAAKTLYQEIPVALELLEQRGVILLHDYFPRLKPLWSDGAVIPGPFLATERLVAEGTQLTVLPLGQLPWPTKLRSDITSLALLLKDKAS
jgi:predicted O-methyltransferase YrrM